MKPAIYLDNNSTTPLDPEVLDLVLPFFSAQHGNAGSRTHAYGWVAQEAVENARRQVAGALNCSPAEIIFTAGATEACNIAILGVAEAYKQKGRHIITVATEHQAVLDTCRHLEKQGWELSVLAVDKQGLVDPSLLESAIRSDTVLVSVMLANNETGVIQDIKQLAEVCHRKGTLLMSDATQAFGKIPVDVQELHVDLLCLSAHKIHGPKGAGALFIRRRDPRVTLLPVVFGGGQERALRPGTQNVPAIAGLGKAAEIAIRDLEKNSRHLQEMRDEFERIIAALVPVNFHSQLSKRLPNTSNFSIAGIRAERAIAKMPSIAIAMGSACSSALPEPSHVLKAMGCDDDEAYASFRVSFGRQNTREEAIEAAKTFQVLNSK